MHTGSPLCVKISKREECARRQLIWWMHTFDALLELVGWPACLSAMLN